MHMCILHQDVCNICMKLHELICMLKCSRCYYLSYCVVVSLMLKCSSSYLSSVIANVFWLFIVHLGTGAMAWYVVFHGRRPGVYSDWANCQAQVTGYSHSSYQKYATMEEAVHAFQTFLSHNMVSSSSQMMKAPARTRMRGLSWWM